MNTQKQLIAVSAESMMAAYDLANIAYLRLADLVAGPPSFRDLPYPARQAWIKAVCELEQVCQKVNP